MMQMVELGRKVNGEQLTIKLTLYNMPLDDIYIIINTLLPFWR